MTAPEVSQVIVMALAHLAVERPGWREMLRDCSREFGPEPMFDRFEAMHRARPVASTDSIMQLRSAVEQVNPLLWAMVREIAWPGGRE